MPHIFPVGKFDRRYPPIMGSGPLQPFSVVPSAAATTSANTMRLVRWAMPKTGTLSAVNIFVGASSGFVEVAVYSLTGNSRSLVATSLSVACPTANTPASISLSAGIPVRFGDQYDIGVVSDNGTATFGRTNIATALWAKPAGTLFNESSGSLPWLTYSVASAFPAPSALSESGFVGSNIYWVFPEIT